MPINDKRFQAIKPKLYAPGALLDLPSLPCRSPLNGTAITSLQVNPGYLSQLEGHNRTSKLLEVWANLYGQIPPINCIGQHENGKQPPLYGLASSYRLYRGLQRGWNDQNYGEDIFIYITKAEYTYEYHPDMASLAKCVKLEDNTVLATYARIFPSGRTEATGVIRGEVIGWDFVSAAFDGRILVPVNSGKRFKEVVW